jgi:hypothetical protein
MKGFKFLTFLFICLCFSNLSNAQNTLNNLGLTSSNLASVAFSVRKLSSAYTGPLMRVRVNTNYYDVYPDASADHQISLNSLISAPISYGSSITSASANNLQSLSATEAYVAIWYDQSGNQNNLSNPFEANQPLIINSNSIITDPSNNKPIVFWDGAGRVLELQTGLSTNGQVIIVNRFGNTPDRDGFLLGDNQQHKYYWHSDDPAPRTHLFIWYASPEIRNGSIFQNGNYKSDVLQTIYNQSLGINSIAPTSPSYQTYWDNIGTERGTTSGSGNHRTTVNAGWSEILSFPAKLNQTLRSSVESNQSAYFGITLNSTNDPNAKELSISSPIATLTSCSGTASSPTTFGVTGSGLTASVTITAPSYFEISTSSGGTYSSSLTLTNTPTVSQTLYVRLNSSATAGDKTGNITATSTGASDVTTTVSGTVKALPTLSVSSIVLCAEATYLITKTTSMPVDNGWSVSGTITVNNGYVTAGTSAGSYTVSYTDGCAQTVSATVTVLDSNDPSLTGLAITDTKVAFKFNGSPQGPSAVLTVNYIGYDGYTYFSQTRPTNVGFYNANIQSGTDAGCPNRFYIFTCATCNN